MSNLRALLKSYGSLAVAYSGGADSTLLLKAALDELGKENVIALIGVSETFPKSEREQAVELAESLGARHIEVMTRELDTKAFAENTVDRCYYCKKELLTKFLTIAKEEGFLTVADGNNADDLKSSRAGLRAVREMGTHSPLAEAGLTKGRGTSTVPGAWTADRRQTLQRMSCVPDTFRDEDHLGDVVPGREGGRVPPRFRNNPAPSPPSWRRGADRSNPKRVLSGA